MEFVKIPKKYRKTNRSIEKYIYGNYLSFINFNYNYLKQIEKNYIKVIIKLS
jgi:hypothetical protein